MALGTTRLRPVIIALALIGALAAADAPIFRIGVADDSAAEFADWRQTANEVVTIAAGQAAPADTHAISRGLKASENPSFTVRFPLAAIPPHGALLTMKLIDAPTSGAQMGVFVNRRCAGLVQLWGTSGSSLGLPWRRTYRVYMPKELLHRGDNELRLTAVRPLWSDAGADARVWWTWDWLGLDALAEPAAEPVHGAVAYLGTTLKIGSDNFRVDDEVVALAPIACRWLGIAYSGNTMRADFWYDVGAAQPKRVEYLRALKDLRMSVLIDHVGPGHFRLEDGKVPARIEADLRAFLAQCGGYAQWYELGNEPCMFGGGLEENVALAELLNRIKPPHLATLATAWAYGGGKGEPKDWDKDVANRRRVEALCDAINGHSYGFSYADDHGGSFIEELRACGGVSDGWPKPYLTSETGTNDWHEEGNGPRLPSSQPHAQAFDRILRAHLAVVDRTMQHAAIFDDCALFKAYPDHDPAKLVAFPPVGQETATRVQTFRRLACAYATHGSPLPWRVIEQGDETRDRLVYVRAVDTSTLAPLPGSGATSDEVLVNLVNFENSSASIRVRVSLPKRGTWRGDRIGAGDAWTGARVDAAIAASPDAEFAADLAPGEAVQWILSPP